MKTILVPWSGGMDSTHLIYYLLETGNKVDAFYTKILNNKFKIKRELCAIKKLNKIFSKYNNFNFIEKTNEYNINSVGMMAFHQFPLFLHDILNNIHPHYNEVNIGYIMGDDAISFLDDFIKTYKSFKYMFNFELPPLKFPLKQANKMEIYNLPDKYLKNITWCESEKKNFCGGCTPCRKMKFYGLYSRHLEKFYPNLIINDEITITTKLENEYVKNYYY